MQLKASDTTYETCLSVTTSPDRLVDFVFRSYGFCVMLDFGKGLKSKGAKTTKDFAFDRGQQLFHNFKAFVFIFTPLFLKSEAQTLLSLFFEEKLNVT